MPRPVGLDIRCQVRHELPGMQAQFLQWKGNLRCNLFWIIGVFDLVELWKIRMFFISSSGPSRTFAIQMSHFVVEELGARREVACSRYS